MRRIVLLASVVTSSAFTLAVASCVGDAPANPDSGSADSGPSATDSGPDTQPPPDTGPSDSGSCVIPDAAAPGSLDLSFTSGVKTVAGGFRARAVAVDPSGAIYVAGAASTGTCTQYDIALVRFQKDGALDPVFNPGNQPRCLNVDVSDVGNAVAILPNGSALVGGASAHPLNQSATVAQNFGTAMLAAFLPDAGNDLGFNGNGHRGLLADAAAGASSFMNNGGTVVVSSAFSTAHGVAVSANKIAVVGSNAIFNLNFPALGSTGYVQILNKDGTTDPNFNSGAALADPTVAGFWGVTFDPNGALIAVGQTNAGVGQQKLAVRAWSPDGKSKTISVDIPLAGGFLGRSIVLLDDGRIVVAGPSNLTGATFDGPLAVTRLLPNGNVDMQFNGGVPLTLPLKSDGYLQSSSLAKLCNNTVLVAGRAEVPNQDLGLTRVTPDGKLDMAFGMNGVARQPIMGDEVPIGAAQDPVTGKVVVVGRDTSANPVLARFNP